LNAAALPSVAGIPIDFILFACTLIGVALFHNHVLKIAVTGLVVITLYKLLFSPFATGAGVPGLLSHLGHEWVIVANLFALLVGFALLSNHFEQSHVPALLPKFLPDDWKGAFVLLVLVFVLSSFLDNIAAAMIGGTVAGTVFKKRVHIGYLAGIVAASNGGGAGSVVGDTTTTMIWIAGGSPMQVLEAYIAAVPALIFFGIRIDGARLVIVALILLSAIGANVYFNLRQPQVLDHVPVIGLAVVLAVIATAVWRQPDWSLVPDAVKGSVFLLSLVLCASMMPVERLPLASWATTLGLGFISAVFDNIPLTALALKQGGYDWGFLAYAVGFGGSMIWFGSSAGVALSNFFPEARSVGQWLRHGWHVAVGYVLGFIILLTLWGWHAEPLRKAATTAPAVEVQK
jgi:Na+/H+ antiporter NhaD/arsenite permease-like protein